VSAEQADPQTGPEASEQELRAAYEAEMQRMTSADMLLQATVSLLNIGGYRLGLAAAGPGAGAEQGSGVRDLEQVRDAIDGARALLPILERTSPQELRPLRDALSQLQMAYAREAGAQAQPGQAGAQAQPGQAGARAQPGQPGARAQPGQPGAGAGQARGSGQVPGPDAPAAGPGSGAEGEQDAQPKQSGPGPAESSGRLWVPGR
jgi:hypothetical protein